MIVWTGRGILSLLFPGLVIFLLVFFKDSTYEMLVFLSVEVPVNLLMWYFGKKWNATVVYFDTQDQQYYKTENDHTVFWIPMQYVSLVILVNVLLALFAENIYIGVLLTAVSAYVIKYDYFKEKGFGFNKAKQRAMSKDEEQGNTPPPLPRSNDWQSRR